MEIDIHQDRSAYILAVDPGLDKMGIAVLNKAGDIIERSVVKKDDFPNSVAGLIKTYQPEVFVVGDGTGSSHVFEIFSSLGYTRVIRVKERNTTLEARELAWKSYPPGGLFKVIPKIFWPAPKDIDGWAAVVIGRRAISDENFNGHL